MKKLFSLVLALSMALALTACSGSADTDSTTDDTTETTAEPVELHVFAAASMQESLDQVIEAYKAVAPEVAVVATYDSSGTLKTQIQEGADCDVFISAAPKQMNQLDAEGGEENTEGLDLDTLCANPLVRTYPLGPASYLSCYWRREEDKPAVGEFIELCRVELVRGQKAN